MSLHPDVTKAISCQRLLLVSAAASRREPRPALAVLRGRSSACPGLEPAFAYTVAGCLTSLAWFPHHEHGQRSLLPSRCWVNWSERPVASGSGGLGRSHGVRPREQGGAPAGNGHLGQGSPLTLREPGVWTGSAERSLPSSDAGHAALG